MQGTNKNQGTSNNQGTSKQGTNKPPIKLLALELVTKGVRLNDEEYNKKQPDDGWRLKMPKDWRTKSTFEFKMQAGLEFNNCKLKLNNSLNKKLSLNMSAIKLPFDWKNKTLNEVEGEMNANKNNEPPVVVMLVHPKIMVKYAGEVEFVDLKVDQQEDEDIRDIADIEEDQQEYEDIWHIPDIEEDYQDYEVIRIIPDVEEEDPMIIADIKEEDPMIIADIKEELIYIKEEPI